MNITNSTLSANHGVAASGTSGGGGIFNAGTVTITNSSLSGNSGGRTGGGILNGGTLTVTSCTISGNTVGILGGGIENEGTVNARNTIIATNTTLSGSGPDFGGTLTSQGYNLIGNTSDTTITGITTGNQLNVDPRLGPLQDNGGPTFTQALLSGSTAIDGGHSSGSNTDQRGFTRPIDDPSIPNATGGDGSDIGAFEVQTLTPIPTPTPTASPTPAAQAVNLSTRLRVQTGDNVGIGGFIITGSTPKHVLLRGIGPSLAASGVWAP